MRKNPRASAKFWLDALRSEDAQSLYASGIQHIRQAVQNGGFTLEDIGTSEQELKELAIKHMKEYAKFWLEVLRSRKSPSLYESAIEYMRQEVKKGGFTLEDIGTSEQEIQELTIMNIRGVAKFWLDALRDKKVQIIHESAIQYLRQAVQSGGFTLEDIGTSEAELRRLTETSTHQRT